MKPDVSDDLILRRQRRCARKGHDLQLTNPGIQECAHCGLRTRNFYAQAELTVSTATGPHRLG